MIRGLAAVALVLSQLTPTSQVEAKSIHKEFSKTWESRDKTYAENYQSLLKVANAAIEKFGAAVNNNEGDAVTLFKTAMRQAREVSEAKGRGLTLIAFREYIDSKPSSARSELWMQEEIDKLTAEKSKLQELREKVEGLPDDADFLVRIGAIQAWIEKLGYVQGVTSELNLIDQNLNSYHKARSADAQRRRAARSAFFASLARGLQQSQNFDDFPTTTNCTTIGFSTQCTTN